MSNQNQSIKIVIAGDLCLRNISSKINAESSEQMLQSIQPVLQQADFRIINLENPLTSVTNPIDKSGPNLKGLPENICFLEAGHFDCAIIANNHLGDFGFKGVTDTLDILECKGIGHAGGGRNLDESYQPWIADKNGIRVAVIATAENEYGGANEKKPGMAGFSLGKLAESIEKAKQTADFVIVIVHGGNEYNPLPSPNVVERYRLIARLGSDAVIGMHPHCPQGFETFRNKPIVYSTGNFLFYNEHNQDERSSWYYGYLPVLTCQEGKGISLEVVPYRFDPDCTRISPFSGHENEKMMAYLENLSSLFQDPVVNAAYFNGWCLLHGPQNASKLVFRSEYLHDPECVHNLDFLILRNLLTCEAHHEVMANLMRLIENGQIESSSRIAEEIRRLQKMPV
ncbi:MAG: CapA family protein [Bacillota bacterium]|nr:CapA family protein [Bacillota bacterium]